MKQYVIINNQLKMSKGKVARVCLMLGYISDDLLSLGTRGLWECNSRKAIILKCDNYDYLLKLLNNSNIKYESHIDLGLTSVPKGSNCGIVFFTDLKIKELEELKLY